MNLILATVLIGSLYTTSYRSVESQTDSSPWLTSIGERVTVRGCAVSQDLLKRNGGPLDYGDLLYVEGLGFRFVNDVMNQRHKRRLDIWVLTAKQEKEFKEGNRQVFLVHSIPKGK